MPHLIERSLSNEQLIREHARRGEFPCDVSREVRSICDPTSAE